MGISLPHLLLILLIVLLVFGAGRLPRVMHDIGKGIRSLREGMKAEEETPSTPEPRPVTHTIDHEAPPVAPEKQKGGNSY